MTIIKKHFLILFTIPSILCCIFLVFWVNYLNGVAKQFLESDKARLAQYGNTIPGLIVALDERNVQDYLLQSVDNIIDPEWVELRLADNVISRFGPPPVDEMYPFFAKLFAPFDRSLYLPFTVQVADTDYSLRVQPNYERYFLIRDAGALLVAVAFFYLTLLVTYFSNLFEQGRSKRIHSLIQQTSKLDAISTRQIELPGDDEYADLGRCINESLNTSRGNYSSAKTQIKKLENQRDRLDVILSSLSVGVAYLDSKSTVLYVNRSLTKLCGVSPAQITRDKINLVELISKVDLVESHRIALETLLQENLYVCRTPVELHLNDQRVLRLRYHVAAGKSNTENGVLLVEDVSVYKNVQNLRLEAETDSLTGLLNRRGFEVSIQELILNLKREEAVGLIYLDLDGFKAVNDTLGHKAGDEILKAVSIILTQAVRNEDSVGRLGGDEFAIVVNRAAPALLNNICQRIIDMCSIDALFERIMTNHQLQVSCSLGYALCPTNARTLPQLIEAADGAMFEAKKAGKNCYRMSLQQSGYSTEER